MNVRKVSFLGVLLALALALHLLEAQIPSPLPWVRPGLANIMTLIALLTAGWRAALLVAVLRVGIGSLLLGGFLGPAFVLSLAGGIASTLVMALMARGGWRLWSPLAVSAAGAVAHRRRAGAGVRRHPAARVGETLRFAMRDWTVVGVFEAGNTGFSS